MSTLETLSAVLGDSETAWLDLFRNSESDVRHVTEGRICLKTVDRNIQQPQACTDCETVMLAKFTKQRYILCFIVAVPSLFALTALLYRMPQVPISNIVLTSQKPSDSSKPPQQQVLLITFGRSGSSFTSAVISHHSDIFYFFEPLFILLFKGKGNVTTTAKNFFINTFPAESISIVRAFLTCQLKVEHVYALENSHFRMSKSTAPFYHCIREKDTASSHLKCFLDFLNQCKESKTTFIKSIRFRMEWTETLLETLPNLKILYLMRDPRAVLYSQSHVFNNFDWHRDVENISSIHCQDIESDLKAYDRLNQLYPDRIKGIRYEHGAVDPVGFSKDIYKFLGLNLTNEDEDYVNTLTNAPKELVKGGVYSVYKENSIEAMDKWRYVASFDSVKIVDAHCSRLYSRLGYKVVQSHQDLLSNLSFVSKPDSSGLFDS